MVNLILSSFAGRARKEEIEIKIQCAIPADLTVPESNLCVLLSNALENALHACVPLAAEGRSCEIDAFNKTSTSFNEVANIINENPQAYDQDLVDTMIDWYGTVDEWVAQVKEEISK